MSYESLLLSCGGGITGTQNQTAPYTGPAVLAIGIGGTGVAALAALKRKVCQQFTPDNPDAPLPRYRHIQFLAIDSDEEDITRQRGKARLDKFSEFFSLQDPGLPSALAAKTSIRVDPRMSWMNIDQIDVPPTSQGAGCVRQIGRCLLIRKADLLYRKIVEKCEEALSGLSTRSVRVYLFAGLSGGTGSGCFLDTCYLVRQVLQDRGWNADSSIKGFFFLPDVLTSRRAVAANPELVRRMDANGYAAMKELDWLMALPSTHDRFRQNYGAFCIDTQKPPVDGCYLVSAARLDGTIPENGFGCAIHVAADYVLSCLAGCDWPETSPGGAGVHSHSANPVYHVLGASSVDVPKTQIATYLASRFSSRFQALVGHDKVVLTKKDVDGWVHKLGLTVQDVSYALQSGSPLLALPDVDKRELASLGVMRRGILPPPWGNPGNAWVDACTAVRERKRAVLDKPLESYDCIKASADSLLGRVFLQLNDLCLDPAYGPYYAAALLGPGEYSLLSALDSIIDEGVKRWWDAMQRGTSELDLQVLEAANNYCNANLFNRNRRYEEYKYAVERRILHYHMTGVCVDTVTALQKLRAGLKELSKRYYIPLIRMMDALDSTFRENLDVLSLPAVGAGADNSLPLLWLSEIKPRLDAVIEDLTPRQLVTEFLDDLLGEPEAWLDGNDGRIGSLVSRHMERVFQQELGRSMQDYLFEKYPQAGGQPAALAHYVEQDILETLHHNAAPLFLCDPNAQPFARTIPTGRLLVPDTAAAVCAAADNFRNSHIDYAVRRTGLQDRILALRVCSGVSLDAYGNMARIKQAFDDAATGMAGAGMCLYAAAHRGPEQPGARP